MQKRKDAKSTLGKRFGAKEGAGRTKVEGERHVLLRREIERDNSEFLPVEDPPLSMGWIPRRDLSNKRVTEEGASWHSSRIREGRKDADKFWISRNSRINWQEGPPRGFDKILLRYFVYSIIFIHHTSLLILAQRVGRTAQAPRRRQPNGGKPRQLGMALRHPTCMRGNSRETHHRFASEAARRFWVDSTVDGVALARFVCSQRKSPVSRRFLAEPLSDLSVLLSEEITRRSRPNGSVIPAPLPWWHRGSSIAPVRAERKNGTENRVSSCNRFCKSMK